jgi:transposase-like protein
MARGVPHPPELRAQVITAVLAGASVTQVAQQTGLHKGLVSRWVATAPQSEQQPVAIKQSEADRLAKLTDQIAANLRETLRAMGATHAARG